MRSFVGGASAPMLFAQIAGIDPIGSKSIGAEAPPTKDFGLARRSALAPLSVSSPSLMPASTPRPAPCRPLHGARNR
ncbi:DUF6053 domain-containing protein [Lysobacter sp. TAB13]|uniref:DUF6053 domain-containing protein n=1 Tax=Lysobacter sp. TAB13 TaxID=3233065 RepID=UPI003F9D3736